MLAVVRAHRLDQATQDEIFQLTFLRLLEHIDDIRKPEALRAWLTAVARNECRRVLRSRETPVDLLAMPEIPVETQFLVDLTQPEELSALREALADLPPASQELLRLLFSDEDLDYRVISEMLNIPIGSIGPTRARCLAKLRDHPAIAGIKVTGT